MRKVITIDGLASTGKSSAAKLLVQRFREAEVGPIVHFSSGLLYRSLGFLSLRHGLAAEDEAGMMSLLDSHTIEIRPDPTSVGVACFIDGTSYDAELRAPEVSERTSQVSALDELRRRLLHLQREACPGTHLVAEGRDMGTVVFPDSPLKFFLVVEARVKADRRLQQWAEAEKLSGSALLARNSEIQREIIDRDRRDETRAVAPTVPADDAIVLDNSALELTQLVEKMYNCAFKRSVFSRP